MRILFANHTSSMSGAEHALMRLVAELAHEHEIRVACPRRGPLAQALTDRGIDRTEIPPFEASFRPHIVHTPAGIARLLAGGVALRRSARRYRTDVLYANTTRAALMGAVASRLDGPPLVMRLHDHLPPTPAGSAVRSLIARSADSVLAVSGYTADRFNDGLAREVASRVYPAIDHDRFDPERVGPVRLREELGLSADAALLGQVAQITEWKGQDRAIRTVAAVRRAGVDAHLVLIGEIVFDGKAVRYDNAAYLESLHRLVDELELPACVHFLGHRNDVPALLRAIDVSLLPSYDEPFGLAALESLAMGTPVLVPRAGGSAEIVQDGVTGRVLTGADPVQWADAVTRAVRDRLGLARMGMRGREAAARFRAETEASEIVAHLDRAIGARPAAHPSARGRIGGPESPRDPRTQWPT